MHLIFKKLFRDIRRGLGQFLSMMLVIAVGCFFFAGMNEASYNLKKSVRTYYDEQNLAAVTGGFLVANDAAVELVAARDGVLGAAGAYRFEQGPRARAACRASVVSAARYREGIDQSWA